MNYINRWLIVISTIAGCISISLFASLVSIWIGITNSAIGLKICVITLGIKKYNSINKKNKKKHNEIILLAKSQLNSIEVLISKAFIDSNISHEAMYKSMLSYYLKCRKNTGRKNPKIVRNKNGRIMLLSKYPGKCLIVKKTEIY